MRISGTRWTTAVFLTVLAATGCSGGTGAAPEPAPRPSTTSAAEFEALYQARMDSVRMDFTEADVRFMTHMIGHHAQAIVMAELAPSHGASSQVQTLAARIISSQRDEIARMQQWLRERGQPVPEVHGADHAMHMPGMLTPDQLRALDQARGPEFDRLFLTYMIQHHGGAVTMVHELFRTDGAAQGDAVFKFASDVQVDQATEIARMERMLAEMSAGDRAP